MATADKPNEAVVVVVVVVNGMQLDKESEDLMEECDKIQVTMVR